MSSRKSIRIMTATGNTMNQYSEQVEGDAYYGYMDGFHTIQVRYRQFVGRLRMQASLALAPTDNDWFEVLPETSMGTAWNPDGYVQFNLSAPANLSEAYTFRGNFMWMRAYMDRDHITNTGLYSPTYGEIEEIIFSA